MKVLVTAKMKKVLASKTAKDQMMRTVIVKGSEGSRIVVRDNTRPVVYTLVRKDAV